MATAWWQQLFDIYLSEGTWEYPERITKQDVAFLDSLLKPAKARSILDLGCGTGRHTLGLGKLGYRVTGLDYSDAIISHDKSRIPKPLQRQVKFVTGDMRSLNYHAEFDAVIMMDVAFGYFDHRTNCKVLKLIAEALTPGGSLVLEVFNPLYLPKMEGRTWWRRGDKITLREVRLDLDECRVHFSGTVFDLKANTHLEHPTQIIRYYAAQELTAMLSRVGLHVERLFGSKQPNDPSGNPLRSDSLFRIVLAKKQP